MAPNELENHKWAYIITGKNDPPPPKKGSNYYILLGNEPVQAVKEIHVCTIFDFFIAIDRETNIV